jgi:hypothetical protein
MDSGGSADGRGVELCDFVSCGGEADGQAFDFAGPAFAFGLCDAGSQVVADLDQAWPVGQVCAE